MNLAIHCCKMNINYLGEMTSNQQKANSLAKGRERRLSLLENLDEIAIIKQIIAKEHPVILEGELRQQSELPSIPEGKTMCLR